MRYPWADFQYGGMRQAWCNVCDTEICQWGAAYGADGVPKASMKKIDEHLAGHGMTQRELVA